MNKVYLLIGGNMGSRQGYLEQATQLINAKAGNVVKESSIYETAAWGNTDQPSFLNRALEIHTRCQPDELMNILLSIEEEMGRKRMEKYGPRIIDIDILFFNDDIVDSPLVTIPHPQVHNRRFALEPMNEIAPGLVHPKFHKTISQLLIECPDPLPVNKI